MKQKKFGISWKYILLIAFVVISAVAVPLSARYLKQTEELNNSFQHIDRSQPEISESFNGEEKKDVLVTVGDTGYPVYVRVAIVITWKDEDDVVNFKKPKRDTDYLLELLLEDWEYNAADGYYYYKKAVESNGQTTVLIQSCKQLSGAEAPDGCTLSVEIIAQTVQAVGSTDVSGKPTEPGIPAYKDAWETSWTAPEPEEPEEPVEPEQPEGGNDVQP